MMPFPQKPKRIILAGIFFITAFYNRVFAFDDDFGQAKKIESRYFVTYYTPQSDIYEFLRQLDIGDADKLLADFPLTKKNSYEAEFAADLDTLFMRVSDVLDMHLYSFKGNIKICSDYEQLKRAYNRIFDKELKALSFYVYDLNTIYISTENFRTEILGHEMAHSVISHYFVVSPPVKIQEVLAGYVEYQLRKPRR